MPNFMHVIGLNHVQVGSRNATENESSYKNPRENESTYKSKWQGSHRFSWHLSVNQLHQKGRGRLASSNSREKGPPSEEQGSTETSNLIEVARLQRWYGPTEGRRSMDTHRSGVTVLLSSSTRGDPFSESISSCKLCDNGNNVLD